MTKIKELYGKILRKHIDRFSLEPLDICGKIKMIYLFTVIVRFYLCRSQVSNVFTHHFVDYKMN